MLVPAAYNAQRCQCTIRYTRNVGMVFDEWLHKTILFAEFLRKLRGENPASRHILIGFAVLYPLCTAFAAFEAQRFSPKYWRIGDKSRLGVNLLAAVERSKCCHMRKSVSGADLGEAVLILHVTVIRAQACVQSGKAGEIIPIDVFVHVLAPLRLVQAIVRVSHRRNTVAQREPVHVEENMEAIRRLSTLAHARARP